MGLTLQEWRALQVGGEEALLPSGLTVTLRRLGIMDLARQGRIPQTLEGQVDRAIKSQGTVSMTLQDVLEFTDLMDLVVQACLVGPEGLTFDELPYNDRLVIFRWANEAAEGLHLFRQTDAESVGVAQNGGSVRAAAKRVARAGAG